MHSQKKMKINHNLNLSHLFFNIIKQKKLINNNFLLILKKILKTVSMKKLYS